MKGRAGGRGVEEGMRSNRGSPIQRALHEVRPTGPLLQINGRNERGGEEKVSAGEEVERGQIRAASPPQINGTKSRRRHLAARDSHH